MDVSENHKLEFQDFANQPGLVSRVTRVSQNSDSDRSIKNKREQKALGKRGPRETMSDGDNKKRQNAAFSILPSGSPLSGRYGAGIGSLLALTTCLIAYMGMTQPLVPDVKPMESEEHGFTMGRELMSVQDYDEYLHQSNNLVGGIVYPETENII